jgi:hypothetical protein
MVEPRRRLPQPRHRHQSKDKMSAMIPYFLFMIGFQHAAYLLFRTAFESGWTAHVGLAPMADAVCQVERDNRNNGKCGRADLFAFQCVSGLVFVGCGLLGIVVFHGDRTLPQATTRDRLFGYHPWAAEITKLNLAYQIWDIIISLTIPENCGWIMMTHHVVAAYLCYSGLAYQMTGYYATFFLGISEVSSIFLVLLDCAKYFDPNATAFPFVKLVALASGGAFAVTFTLYRVILWWPTSIQLFRDVYSDTATAGTPEQMRELKTWLFFNIPMGCLQLYWLAIILGEVKAVIIPLT